MITEKIQELEGQLKSCAENADALAQELPHCPSALAFKGRIGHALEMLGSLKREAATLPKPGNTIAALLLFAGLLASSICAPTSASAQIIYGAANVTNGTLSCPVQQAFTPVTAAEAISVGSHVAQISNVTTNEWITLWYGRQPQGAVGTNLTQFASLTTNFNASWCAATFGYTTNNFSTIITFPPVQTTPVDAMWGTFSNYLGSNSVSFF